MNIPAMIHDDVHVRPLLKLSLPVADGRQRHDDKVRPLDPSIEHLLQEGNGLDRLSQAHLVSKDAVLSASNNAGHVNTSGTYRQVSNIRSTKSQHLKCSRTVLRLSLPNPLKPDVKSRMKMQLEQRRQAMLQLHLSDQQFYCLQRCVLYQRFYGNCFAETWSCICNLHCSFNKTTTVYEPLVGRNKRPVHQGYTQITRTTRTPAFWGYPRRLMITHTIESLDPKSREDKVKVTNLIKIRQNFKCLNFEMGITRDTPSEVAWYDVQIWNGCDEYCWRYRADTILSTDGQGDTSIPPFQLRWSEGIIHIKGQSWI